MGVIVLGLSVVVAVAVGVGMAPRLKDLMREPSSSSKTGSSSVVSPFEPAPLPSAKSEMPLTMGSIEALLADLDQAIRRKDVEGVLRHIAPDAVILIHMKQGAHQQTAVLTREDYRKALAAEFAFPSADDFARENTKVSLAPDERSAKISFKTTETLRQADREFTVEGEETLVVTMRGGKPTIVSLERDVPGDST
ncbi:MAG: nuclear transport factor 2 family protein [Nitrospira sp.]|nr:nuclear transport factor 2 family protein [Nitrospira sp.]MCP9442054.1 nuclear transport factor 2 family protein [Nitrospira sp.]